VFQVASTRPDDARVVRLIKADRGLRRVPLLCLTVSTPGWGCADVRALGADACLEMPFDLDVLVATARAPMMKGQA
jgi:DNA-binding response OmpR family regulator